MILSNRLRNTKTVSALTSGASPNAWLVRTLAPSAKLIGQPVQRYALAERVAGTGAALVAGFERLPSSTAHRGSAADQRNSPFGRIDGRSAHCPKRAVEVGVCAAGWYCPPRSRADSRFRDCVAPGRRGKLLSKSRILPHTARRVLTGRQRPVSGYPHNRPLLRCLITDRIQINIGDFGAVDRSTGLPRAVMFEQPGNWPHCWPPGGSVPPGAVIHRARIPESPG